MTTRREPLIQMLRQLQTDMQTLHQAGAGYYSCIPFARRYNKLLGQAKTLFGGEETLMSTFDVLEERDPKDPSEKSQVLQGIRVETGQLITLLEATRPKEPAPAPASASGQSATPAQAQPQSEQKAGGSP